MKLCNTYNAHILNTQFDNNYTNNNNNYNTNNCQFIQVVDLHGSFHSLKTYNDFVSVDFDVIDVIKNNWTRRRFSCKHIMKIC